MISVLIGTNFSIRSQKPNSTGLTKGFIVIMKIRTKVEQSRAGWFYDACP